MLISDADLLGRSDFLLSTPSRRQSQLLLKSRTPASSKKKGVLDLALGALANLTSCIAGPLQMGHVVGISRAPYLQVSHSSLVCGWVVGATAGLYTAHLACRFRFVIVLCHILCAHRLTLCPPTRSPLSLPVGACSRDIALAANPYTGHQLNTGKLASFIHVSSEFVSEQVEHELHIPARWH